jgi:hypothetical protein
MEKEVDEGRKRTLGVIATIFACRKLSALEGKPSPAREMAFRDSIDLAVEMMRRIFALAYIEAIEVGLSSADLNHSVRDLVPVPKFPISRRIKS